MKIELYLELKKAVGEWLMHEKIRISLAHDDTYETEQLYRKAYEAGEAAEQRIREVYEQMED